MSTLSMCSFLLSENSSLASTALPWVPFLCFVCQQNQPPCYTALRHMTNGLQLLCQDHLSKSRKLINLLTALNYIEALQCCTRRGRVFRSVVGGVRTLCLLQCSPFTGVKHFFRNCLCVRRDLSSGLSFWIVVGWYKLHQTTAHQGNTRKYGNEKK